MSENRANWAEKATLASSVLANAQLQQLHATLKTLGALEAEKTRIELNEKQNREREDRLREHLWQTEQSFDAVVRQANANAVCIISTQIEDMMARYKISAPSFRQFVDKDRLSQFIGRLQQARNDAISKMTAPQRAEWETYLRYKNESSELDNLVEQLQTEQKRNEHQVNQLARVSEQREAALTELEKLRGSERSKRAWSAGQIALAQIGGSLLFGIGLLSAIVGICGFALGEHLAGSILMAVCPGCFAVMYWLQQQATRQERIAAQQQVLAQAESEISDSSDVTPLVDKDSLTAYANAFPGIKSCVESGRIKFEAVSLADLVQKQNERQAFMQNYRHANGVTDDELFEDTSSRIPREIAVHTLSPEVQEMARRSHQKVSAILLHQKQTGASAAEAKEAVEAFAMEGRQ